MWLKDIRSLEMHAQDLAASRGHMALREPITLDSILTPLPYFKGTYDEGLEMEAKSHSPGNVVTWGDGCT